MTGDGCDWHEADAICVGCVLRGTPLGDLYRSGSDENAAMYLGALNEDALGRLLQQILFVIDLASERFTSRMRQSEANMLAKMKMAVVRESDRRSGVEHSDFWYQMFGSGLMMMIAHTKRGPLSPMINDLVARFDKNEVPAELIASIEAFAEEGDPDGPALRTLSTQLMSLLTGESIEAINAKLEDGQMGMDVNADGTTIVFKPTMPPEKDTTLSPEFVRDRLEEMFGSGASKKKRGPFS